MDCRFLIFGYLIVSFFSCENEVTKTPSSTSVVQAQTTGGNLFTIFSNKSEYIADAFDFPVGKPDGKGYYNAQPFGKNTHLGDDWNAVTGGDTDLGDPIYSVANGYVRMAKDVYGGWGNVVRVVHLLPDSSFVESLYAHCDTILVQKKTFVQRGEQIATIGNANGLYKAHLHLEVRDSLEMPVGKGYSKRMDGYLNPTTFINSNREIE